MSRVHSVHQVYTKRVKVKVPNPFVLLSDVAQMHGVYWKYNGASVYCLSLVVLKLL